MTLFDFYPILIQLILALMIGIVILVASHVFGQRSYAFYII